MIRGGTSRASLSLAMALGFSACAPIPTTPPGPGGETAAPGVFEPTQPVSTNSAVIALVDTARRDKADGRADTAGASLERALRIEPRNPMLWHELAQVRLAQGQYQQAEALAQKSNVWAGDDNRLKGANWRVIGEARTRRGDSEAAREAFARAAEIENR